MKVEMDAKSRRDLKWADFKFNKRRWEFELITSAIKEAIPIERRDRLRILEFGCGRGIGAQYLCQLGDLVVTDIYEDSLLSLPPGVKFKIADIHKTDFKDNEFDVLVSNMVLEHLENIKKAFDEMKRIGDEDAYYVFGVPTITWLILRIPSQLFRKFENISARIKGRVCGKVSKTTSGSSCRSSAEKSETCQVRKGWLRKFAVGGHGCYPRFSQCWRFFKIRNWESVLSANGFEIARKTPLLTYGSSHLPIIPTNRFLARCGLSSSFLFICKKSDKMR